MYELLCTPRKTPYIEPRASGVYTREEVISIVNTFNRMRMPSGAYPTYKYGYRRKRVKLQIVKEI